MKIKGYYVGQSNLVENIHIFAISISTIQKISLVYIHLLNKNNFYLCIYVSTFLNVFEQKETPN